jgi:UDP-glucosyl transferase 73C
MKDSQKPHVVLVPFPALGHSIPFVDLARLLALHGAAVSYITTSANASRLGGAMAEAQTAGLDIRSVILPTPAVEGLPEGRESTDVLPAELINLLVHFAEKLAEPFEQWFHQQLQQNQEQEETGRSPPVCIISDIGMLWTLQIGEKYGVPRVLFNTCGAFAMTLLYSVSASISHNTLQKDGDKVALSMNLPCPLRFNKNEIAAIFFGPDMLNHHLRQFVVQTLQSLTDGWGMLINTFEELEPQHLMHFRNLSGKPIWSIGPVLPPSFTGKAGRGKIADISEDELVRWLDSQRPRSVVYVSFGSQIFLSERQTVALARGLEASGQPFIWAIKVAPKLESTTADTAAVDAESQAYLPHGFEDRMRNKGSGLIIWGWAPQLLILSHQSVGAFITHCGWNSTLESITLGVPLITWPMSGDQHFNSMQVAEQFGIGVQFCQQRDGIPDEERVSEVVRLLLTEAEGKKMRKHAEKLKEMASKAVREGGSSKTNLQAFVCEMQKLTILRSRSGKKQTGDKESMPMGCVQCDVFPHFSSSLE